MREWTYWHCPWYRIPPGNLNKPQYSIRHMFSSHSTKIRLPKVKTREGFELLREITSTLSSLRKLSKNEIQYSKIDKRREKEGKKGKSSPKIPTFSGRGLGRFCWLAKIYTPTFNSHRSGFNRSPCNGQCQICKPQPHKFLKEDILRSNV